MTRSGRAGLRLYERCSPEALGSSVIRIHHVGSTSIPGLTAKPIIDLDLEIPDYSHLPSVETKLARLGYSNAGDQGIPDRLAFTREGDRVPYSDPPRKWIEHHLYVCPSFGVELHRHLQFRGFLLAHPEAREEYVRIKRQIEAESNDDRKRYATIKEERARAFVEGILAKASQGRSQCN